MDAVKFIEERNRMCKSFEAVYCKGCPAFNAFEDNLYCAVDQESTLDATAQIAIVEKWSAEHPRKTRQSVFLERYPEANVDKSTGVLVLCPAALKKEYRDDRGACNAYSIESGVCDNCRRAFWMQEVE